jgi:hypothetical protein
MKKIICGIVVGASLFAGCGQGSVGPVGGTPGSSSEALAVVDDCVAQAKTCASAAKSVADGEACGKQLRACLEPLIAEAGTVPPVVIPPIDAALPPIPDPAKVEAAVRACVDALHTCLTSSTDPMTCADQAHTCIKQAI